MTRTSAQVVITAFFRNAIWALFTALGTLTFLAAIKVGHVCEFFDLPTPTWAQCIGLAVLWAAFNWGKGLPDKGGSQ